MLSPRATIRKINKINIVKKIFKGFKNDILENTHLKQKEKSKVKGKRRHDT